MARRTRTFLKEFVVLFGFLNGVFVAVGFNPGAALLGVLAAWLQQLVPSPTVGFALALLPLALLVAMLVLIHRKGGWVGLAAVGVAFLGGASVTADPAFALVALLAAFALGWFATKR